MSNEKDLRFIFILTSRTLSNMDIFRFPSFSFLQYKSESIVLKALDVVTLVGHSLNHMI